jgi:hypothetical protein
MRHVVADDVLRVSLAVLQRHCGDYARRNTCDVNLPHSEAGMVAVIRHRSSVQSGLTSGLRWQASAWPRISVRRSACMKSIYDHLSVQDRRLVARWRAVASAGAIAALLAVFAVIAVLQPGDSLSAATQVAATKVN